MAITLISEPAQYQPGFNPIEFVFDSDNSGQCEFVYIADVYINGVFAIRTKAFPEGNDNYGYFRVERIIQDFLSFNFLPKVTEFTEGAESVVSYYLEIRERYNTTTDCTGLPTLGAVDYTSDLKYAWNGALQYEEYPVYSINNYVAKTIFSKFLTNSPDGLKLRLDEYSTLSFLQDIDNPVYQMSVKTYGYDSVLIDEYLLDNPHTTPSVPELFLTVGTGPENLNNTDFATSPSQPIIDSSVWFYDIMMLDASEIQVTEIKRYYIDLKCSSYRDFKFYWLSRLGGFDRFTFDLKSFIRVPISRTQYTKSLPSDYQVGDRGDKVISIDARNAYVMNTDWMTEEVALWLEELFTSPEACIFEIKTLAGDPPITGASCSLPESFPITGAVHRAANSTADIFITEGSPGSIPDGTYFDYTGTNFTAIGAANSGTHRQIISYDSGGGFYYTDIVSTINAGALITGTLFPEPISPAAVSLTIASPFIIPNGTEFTYTVNDGSPIGMPNSGTGTIISYDSGSNTYLTDITCTIEAGALISGTLSYDTTVDKLIPIVITSPEYEEKIKKNVKNIQYTITCTAAYKKNIQSF